MKRTKRIALAMATLFVSTAVISSNVDESVRRVLAETGLISKVDVWSAPFEEMVKLDAPMSDYASIKQEAKLSVQMARAESEGTQLILSANADVDSYDITLNDLTSASGDVFSKDDMQVYAYKYTYLGENKEANRQLGTGYFPNAILPLETSKEFKENNIKANQNQGIYVRFDVDAEQAAGVYTGSATLTVDGETTAIPVELTVWDLTVSEVTHMKTLFDFRFAWYQGELDSTRDKWNDYLQLLSDYRLSPYVVFNVNHQVRTDKEVEKLVDATYDWCKNPRNSTYMVPYWEDAGNFNAEMYEKTLQGLANKSFETELNLLTKAVGHFNSLIDEPEGQGTMDKVPSVVDRYKDCLANVAADIRSRQDAIAAEYGVSVEFVLEVADEIATMPHVITNAYHPQLAPSISTNDAWCPNVWNYWKNTTQSQLDEILSYYAGQDERWWYGCTGESSPGPSYHLDDILLSPRVTSWLQVEFDIVGNLYFCMRQPSDDGPMVDTDPEDYYALGFNTGGISNGDGQLCFPGMQYNLDMPVATRRLESIRNGIEDYELIWELKELYKAQFGNEEAFDAVYAQATKDMYELAHIKNSVAGFNYGRTLIAELLMMAHNGVFVQDLSFDGDSYAMTVFAKENKTVSVDGANATEATAEGGKTYSLRGDVGSMVEISVNGVDAFNSATLVIKK